MKTGRNTAFKRLVLFYALGLALYLLLGLGRLALYAARRPAAEALLVENMEYSGIVLLEQEGGAQHLTSSSLDPQIILRRESPFPVYLLRVAATADRPIGEMVLYYNTAAGQEFSEARKLFAQKDGAGNWVFNLGGRRCTALRLDLDSVGGVVWAVQDIVLNPPLAWHSFFVPGAGGLFWLLLLPGLAAAALPQLLQAVLPYLRRMREKGSRKTPGPPKLR